MACKILITMRIFCTQEIIVNKGNEVCQTISFLQNPNFGRIIVRLLEIIVSLICAFNVSGIFCIKIVLMSFALRQMSQ